MEPRRLEAFYPTLGAANSRLALTPVAKSGAASAHDAACICTKGLSATAAGSAYELEEDDARAHVNADDANVTRDWRAIVIL
jgi:hypothetical protein